MDIVIEICQKKIDLVVFFLLLTSPSFGGDLHYILNLLVKI
jgi:hypothetical protein